MDWVIEHVWWLLGMLAVYIVGAESRVMWEQIRPKGLHYTPFGLALAAGLALMLWLFAILVRFMLSDEPVSSAMATIFIACVILIATLGTVTHLLVKRLRWRLRVIEKHCGLPVLE